MANEPDPVQEAVDAASKQLGRAVGNLKRWSGSLQASSPNMVRAQRPPPPKRRISQPVEAAQRSVEQAKQAVQPTHPNGAPIQRSVLAPPPPEPRSEPAEVPVANTPVLYDAAESTSENEPGGPGSAAPEFGEAAVVEAAPLAPAIDALESSEPPVELARSTPAQAPSPVSPSLPNLDHAADRRSGDLNLVVSATGFALPPPPAPLEIPPPSSLLIEVPVIPGTSGDDS